MIRNSLRHWLATGSSRGAHGGAARSFRIGAELRADTVHGSVRVAAKMDGARVEDNHVEGRLGKGGGELRLRTVNGPIDVR